MIYGPSPLWIAAFDIKPLYAQVVEGQDLRANLLWLGTYDYEQNSPAGALGSVCSVLIDASSTRPVIQATRLVRSLLKIGHPRPAVQDVPPDAGECSGCILTSYLWSLTCYYLHGSLHKMHLQRVCISIPSRVYTIFMDVRAVHWSMYFIRSCFIPWLHTHMLIYL